MCVDDGDDAGEYATRMKQMGGFDEKPCVCVWYTGLHMHAEHHIHIVAFLFTLTHPHMSP